MKLVPSRFEALGTSIFSQMSALSLEHGAINLAQGFPDFDGPPVAIAAACNALMSARNQYAPSSGIAELRQGLSKRYRQRFGLEFDPDREICVFSGATEALFVSFLACFEKSDEIICFEPFYDSYAASAVAAHAQLRCLPIDLQKHSFQTSDLEDLLSPNTKAILINSPHNPSGMVFSERQLDELAAFANRHDLLVIADEVYEELIYGGQVHIPIATRPEMRDRTITISSFGKTFSLTGWKLGYALAPATLIHRLKSVHQFTVFCSATPLQWGALAALQIDDSYFSKLRCELEARRDQLMSTLRSVGFHPILPHGGYFILADYSQLSDLDDQQFARYMTQHAGVSCIPISGFYRDEASATSSRKVVRFAFCKTKETLCKASERLQIWQSKTR